jgi:hypothetical protein
MRISAPASAASLASAADSVGGFWKIFPGISERVTNWTTFTPAFYGSFWAALADQVYDFYSRESPDGEQMDSKRLDSFFESYR